MSGDSQQARECLSTKEREGGRARASRKADFEVMPFVVMPWVVPRQVSDWKEGLVDGSVSRPLVLIGPPRCGKSYWAQSFGNPVVVDGRLDLQEVLRSEGTHVVLNDATLVDSSDERERAATCEGLASLGERPTVWTCNEHNSVLDDPVLGPYLVGAGAVVVRVPAKMYVYLSRVGDKEEFCKAFREAVEANLSRE